MPALLRRPVFWIVIAGLMLLVGGGLVFNSQRQAQKAEAAMAAEKAAPLSPYVAIANGKADVEGGLIQVAARSAGIVREVLVQEGDSVQEGQILARLEDDEQRLSAARVRAELEQARAQIALTQVEIATASREFDRLDSLSASNFVAGQRLDQARDVIRQGEARLRAQRAAVATAEARLAEAGYNLELTMIRAPADGVIVRRYANPGSGASTLNVSNMFDLEPTGQRIVRAEIAEGALPHVSLGQSVEIASEADPTQTFKGQVMRRDEVFGARKLGSDDPAKQADERVVEVVVSAQGAPFLVGQRVLVKFLRPAQSAAAKAVPGA